MKLVNKLLIGFAGLAGLTGIGYFCHENAYYEAKGMIEAVEFDSSNCTIIIMSEKAADGNCTAAD